MAEIYITRSNLEDAQLTFTQWKEMEHAIENQRLHDRATKIAESPEKCQEGFFVTGKREANFSIAEQTERLRHFLIHQVRSHFGNEKLEFQAHKLGVQRQTLANWLSQTKQRQ